MKKALLLVVIGLLVSGCAGLGGISGEPTLSLYLTDAPVNGVEVVKVTFTEVQVVGEDGPQVINSFPEGLEVNLLELRFDEMLLGENGIPAGSYEQIRLIVSGDPGANEVIYEDGSIVPLKIPSGEQTGFKISYPFVISGGHTEFVLDANVAEFIRDTGQGNNLRSTSIRVVDRIESGLVEGKVGVGEELVPVTDYDVLLQLIKDGETYAETLALRADSGTRLAGEYRFNAVEAGEYTLVAVVNDGTQDTYRTELPITVVNGETTTQDIILETINSDTPPEA